VPKASPLINNFSAGEFGPLARARVDLDRYAASQELCQNAVPRIQGGAVKRDGTHYIAEVKDSTKKVRLEKFVFSNEQAYVLEFGEEYIRFYTERAQIQSGMAAYEITSPYDVLDLFELSFCQINDLLYIFHEDYAPRRLVRVSDTNWDLSEVVTLDGPYGHLFYYDINTNVQIEPSSATGSVSLTVSAVGGTALSATNSGGRYLINHGGLASAVAFKTGDLVTLPGLATATGTAGTWEITVIDANNFILNGSTYVADSTGSCDLYPAIFRSDDVGRYIRMLQGTTWGYALITGYTSGRIVTATVKSTLTNTNAKTTFQFGAYSATTGYPAAGCFHEDRLFLVGPQQLIAGSVVGDYENFSPSAAGGTVSDDNSVSFFLNSNESANCKWVVSDEKGLLVGTNSNEYLIKSASTQSPITPTSVTAKKTTSYGSKYIQPLQVGKAVIFTQASGRKLREFNYFYDVDGFRCQDMTQLAHHITESGVNQISLQRQPEQIVWGAREDGVLIGMTYERDVDGLRAAWHRHVIGGYSDAANNPAIVESVCVIPTDDNSYDEIWLVVKRYINGSTKRYIEYIGKPFDEEVDQQDGFFVDCGLTYDSAILVTGVTKANPAVATCAAHGFSNGDTVRFDDILGMTQLNGNIYKVANAAANTFELTTLAGANVDSSSYTAYVSGGETRKLVTSISGLSHLQGQMVRVCGDGADLGSYTVSGGAITLDEPCAVVHVGLPYQTKMKFNRIEAGSADGTALGKTRRLHRLGAFLHRTLGLKYGQSFDDMYSFEFQDGNGQLNQAAPLYSGIMSGETDMDYDFENQICIMHDFPTPMTLLALMPQMHTQDR